MADSNVVLFSYKFSPYANKVKAYLALRRIQYSDCEVLHILPRPELLALNVHYRRIPVLAIGRDIYVDTKAIIKRLEEIFPASDKHPALSTPDSEGLGHLLNHFIGAPGGVFGRAASVMTPEFGAMKDPKFRKDRSEFFGPKFFEGGWKETSKEAIVHMRSAFVVLESLLQDGRQWLGNTAAPSIADLESEWVFNWFVRDLQAPKKYFNAEAYPKSFAWIQRFETAFKAAKQSAGKPIKVNGEQVLSMVTSAAYTDTQTTVDSNDPLQLPAGTLVEVYPTDFGGRGHQDRGNLVKLVHDEVAIELEASNGKNVRLHAPRWSFRIRAVSANDSKL